MASKDPEFLSFPHTGPFDSGSERLADSDRRRLIMALKRQVELLDPDDGVLAVTVDGVEAEVTGAHLFLSSTKPKLTINVTLHGPPASLPGPTGPT